MRYLVVIIGAVVVLFTGILIYRAVGGASLSTPAAELSDLPGTQNENDNLVEQSERQNADFMDVEGDGASVQDQRLEQDKQEVLQQDERQQQEQQLQELRDQQQREQQNQLPEPIQNSVKPVKLNNNY